MTLKCNKIEWTLILQHLIRGMVPFFGPFLGLNMFEIVWKDIWGEDVSTVDPRPWFPWHCGVLPTADESFSTQRRPKKVSFGSSNLCWPSDVSVSWDYMISVLISLNHWFQPRIRMILGSPLLHGWGLSFLTLKVILFGDTWCPGWFSGSCWILNAFGANLKTHQACCCACHMWQYLNVFDITTDCNPQLIDQDAVIILILSVFPRLRKPEVICCGQDAFKAPRRQAVGQVGWTKPWCPNGSEWYYRIMDV